ncbi:hypothetical protein K504DRAFT_465545 [Pleomassaria siparia CBS 279.74]|uniref:Uncharacterized protein n=1 Tax=Pleomassaria siparia CBS 279.74 TaxID=1314801 RepID=A0A6G1KGA6_9PLEO|nr:hypothetical protein K504DRAFT_465545 [Pleomassaria siparia CBS 279.74]
MSVQAPVRSATSLAGLGPFPRLVVGVEIQAEYDRHLHVQYCTYIHMIRRCVDLEMQFSKSSWTLDSGLWTLDSGLLRAASAGPAAFRKSATPGTTPRWKISYQKWPDF